MIGVDLGGTQVRAALVQDGKLLSRVGYLTQDEEGFEAVLGRIKEAIRQAALQAGVPLEHVVGIGIGAPGPLDSRTGILFAPPNLRGWRNVPANDYVDVPTSGDEASATRNLAAISFKPRVAFLLSAVESFSPKEIAQTLECSPGEASELIDRAADEISAQIRTTVLIIEDEPLIALDIQTLVEQLGHDVTTIARTHTEAVRAALKRRPGLILADIQLADGSSGLDAVNEILGVQEVPVIFITAFPERFLTGQAPEPAFLIAKPFSADSVKAVISQALFFDRKSQRKMAKATVDREPL